MLNRTKSELTFFPNNRMIDCCMPNIFSKKNERAKTFRRKTCRFRAMKLEQIELGVNFTKRVKVSICLKPSDVLTRYTSTCVTYLASLKA